MQNGIADSAADIAGQYVDQQDLAGVTNPGNSLGAPTTPASHETKSSSKRGRRKISVNTNIEESSTSHLRPVNTNTNQPSSPYGRAISPTTNDLSSAHGFTYGSASSEPTTRRPVNPSSATPLGQYERAGNSITNSPSSPYGREIIASSEAPRSPHVRTGKPGHENIPGNSPSGSGGLSESLGRSKPRDDTRGTQCSNVTQ